MKNNVKKLTLAGLLTAFAIIIPIVFGSFLRIQIPPFSATLFSHVPMFLAMLIAPEVAVIVGIGSALGLFNYLTGSNCCKSFYPYFCGIGWSTADKKGGIL
jgi:niacin transporter